MRALRLTSRLLTLLLAVAPLARLAAQEPAPAADTATAYVRDAGPGRPGRILRAAFAEPHLLILGGDSAMPRPLRLPRDSVFPRTVIVLNADVAVESRVRGHLIVVNGGLFLRPGAEIHGNAVAIGDGVYNSTLAIVHGERMSFRDVGFATFPTSRGIALDYRELDRYDRPLVELVGLFGFGFPTYDRSNGLSVPWGPLVNLAGGSVEVEPRATYRSDLGAVDPSVETSARLGRRNRAELWVGRGTFTNESWIRGDIANSLASLSIGADERNYYRADRADARFFRRWEGETSDLEAFVGGLTEHAWSTGPEPDPEHVVWSLLNRRDEEEGMIRLNPPVTKGRISSAVTGATARWEQQQVRLTLGARVEVPFDAPGDRRFVQTTIDGSVRFPAMRTHLVVVETHAVVTAGDSAPPQRFTYVGGSSTLPTLPYLVMGGDQAFYVDSRYVIPVDRIAVPYLGTGSVALRYAAGSAGVGELPDFVQNVGVRLGIGFLKLEYMFDPKRRDSDVAVGISFGR